MAKTSVITEEFGAIQAALEVLEPLNETQRRFAVSMILSRLGMSATDGTPGSGGGVPSLVRPQATGSEIKALSSKDFLKQKQPRTDLERFLCLAYYLTHAQVITQFTTRDITKLNGEAHGQNFTNAAATAQNGMKQSKFFSNASGGKKRITTLGESVVEALPSAEKVKEVLDATRGRAVTRRKRQKAKS
ncbi:MAG: hypothetical protein ACKVQU_01230 [Burkholderiales bacterium]